MALSTKPENQPAGIERTLGAKISLYYDLLAPEQRPAPLLIALHGYGENKQRMMREARRMAPDGFAIASLQGPHQHLKDPKEPGGPLRFGFGWLTNFHPEESVATHHRALLDLIDSLVNEGTADRQRIFLLGFSQSCALNYRFAFAYPDRLRGAVGICGGIPGDWESSDVYKQTHTAILHLSGDRDEYYPPGRVANYAECLLMRAADVEVRSFDAGHEIVPAMSAAVQTWLALKSA